VIDGGANSLIEMLSTKYVLHIPGLVGLGWANTILLAANQRELLKHLKSLIWSRKVPHPKTGRAEDIGPAESASDVCRSSLTAQTLHRGALLETGVTQRTSGSIAPFTKSADRDLSLLYILRGPHGLARAGLAINRAIQRRGASETHHLASSNNCDSHLKLGIADDIATRDPSLNVLPVTDNTNLTARSHPID
jgi:hypothetical protein